MRPPVTVTVMTPVLLATARSPDGTLTALTFPIAARHGVTSPQVSFASTFTGPDPPSRSWMLSGRATGVGSADRAAGPEPAGPRTPQPTSARTGKKRKTKRNKTPHEGTEPNEGGP